jgi:hypothetical protein
MATGRIAACGLVRHLRQVLYIDVNEARLIVLERLLGRDRLSLGLRDHVLQARHAFAFQKARDTGARDVRIDILPGNVEQVVERQIERLAQRQDDGLLRAAQGRMQRVGAVRTVLHILAPEPLGGGGARDVEDLRCRAIGQARVLDLLADFRRRAGLWVNARTHATDCS